jgi:ABC-type transporter Mla MlaB component
MSLRITETADREGTTLVVDGRLSGDEVGELTRASESAAAPLTLDLAGLLFADSQGVDALREIRARGAKLRHVPPYVSLLLEMNSKAAPPAATRGGRSRKAG